MNNGRETEEVLMVTQEVTLQLPEAVLERAKEAARMLEHPVEEVLASMLEAILPQVEDVPSDLQAELARMTWLSDQELWDTANSQMSDSDQEQLQRLTELQIIGSLEPAEQQMLESLRQEYGSVTLRKARAYALLSLRGGAPLLKDM